MNASRPMGGMAAIAAAIALLAGAPAASAAFSLESVSATPASPAAGANTDFSISLEVEDADADIKDLTIHLPPGLVGNPLATPTCTEAQLLNDGNCPAISDVGDVTNNVTVDVLGFLPATLDVPGQLYNVTPRPGEPARFGIVLDPSPIPGVGGAVLPKTILQSGAVLRPADFGLDTVLNDLPNSATVLLPNTPVHINSIALKLDGVAGSPPTGFIRNPTSCKTHAVGFDATTHDPPQTASAQTTFDTTDCAALPFAPGFEAKLKPMGTKGLRPELTTVISQTLAEAGLSRAQVILPPELGADNAKLATQCSMADFDAGNCPATTIIGSARASSPLLSEPLTGSVALIVPPTPGLPQIGLDLRGALALKLTGSFVLTAAGLGVEFAGLPDIPISRFALTFTGGGDGLLVASRSVCDQPPLRFTTDFLAFSGATTSGTTNATAEGLCTGDGGSNKPKATVKLKNARSEQPKLIVKVKAGSTKLRKAKLKLPRGLSFASGKTFDKGITAKAGTKKLADKAIKHSRRSLGLKVKKGGVGSFTAKAARGALQSGKGLAGRPKFKFVVRDAVGKRTKLTVRPKK